MSKEWSSPDSVADSARVNTSSERTSTAASPALEARDYGQRLSESVIAAREYISDRVAAFGERIPDLSSKSLDELTEDARAYVVRNPGWSILASATAGLLLGFWLRSKEHREERTYTAPVLEEEFVARRSRATPVELRTAQKYVISIPTGFRLSSGRYEDQLKKLVSTEQVQIIDQLGEDSDRLALLRPDEVEQLKAKFPGLVIEPNILHKKARHPLLEGFEAIYLPSSARRKKITIKVLDKATGDPVEGASIYLQPDPARLLGFEGTTDENGTCSIMVTNSTQPYVLSVVPKHDYWSRVVQNVSSNGIQTVALEPLPTDKNGFFDWGHRFADMRDDLPLDGSGIKIGIIDSGIRRDHPGIKPAGGYNCVLGEDPSHWYDDADGHGTHCAGIIASTISKNGLGTKGYVPRAQIRAYRIFADGAELAESFDIAKAIKQAVEDGCDIINMSFGSTKPATGVRNQIQRAYDNGVLCVAAAGNEGGDVNYPAAFNWVMGVGAFGNFKVYPSDSLHHETETNIRSADGDYFVANFSNFGDGVDFSAPGVAILSTVPGGYSAWDGTSMACPQVTGLAALTLAAHPDILNAPRDPDRVERLIQTLRANAHRLEFGSPYEGAGYLRVPSL